MPAVPAAAAADRRQRDAAMFRRYRRSADPRHREQLIERFMPLAHTLARRYDHGSTPGDDLVQVAALGLVKAVDRYDETRGHTFSTFAVPVITGELRRYLRDKSWMVRPPRTLLENALRVAAAVERYRAESGCSPTVAQLVGVLGDIDEAGVLEALEAGSASSALSLQAPRGGEGDADLTLGEQLGADDPELDLAEHRIQIDALQRVLSQRQRDVLRMRFHDGMSQAEIGEIVGVSQMQISRILRQAIARMRVAAGV